MEQIHGGNLRAVSLRFGVPEKEILDFSASINPLGTPKSALKAMLEEMDRLVHYPEIDALALREALAQRDRFSPENILAGNGSTEFIYLIPRALRPKKAMILLPTYSDYQRALCVSGAECVHFPLDKEEGFALNAEQFLLSIPRDLDLILLCNPNNPTGTLIPKVEMKKIVSATEATGTTLVVDEAFMGFAPGESIRFHVTEYRHLMVLRSLTKFYGIPGLRAGVLYGPESLMDRIKSCQEPWTLNRLSQAASMAALADESYSKQTVTLVQQEREYLADELGRIPGVRVFPSRANFLLLETGPPMPKADRLFMALLRSGILVRDCASFARLGPGFFRVAVRNRDENDLLIGAMSKAGRSLA